MHRHALSWRVVAYTDSDSLGKTKVSGSLGVGYKACSYARLHEPRD